jgi:hypothetical protein
MFQLIPEVDIPIGFVIKNRYRGLSYLHAALREPASVMERVVCPGLGHFFPFFRMHAMVATLSPI